MRYIITAALLVASLVRLFGLFFLAAPFIPNLQLAALLLAIGTQAQVS